MRHPKDFEEIESVSPDGLVMVTLSWEGDYDPDYAHDIPLLRYSLYRKYKPSDGLDKALQLCKPDVYNDGDWMNVRDGNHCTQLHVWEDRDWLHRAVDFIHAWVGQGLREYQHEKRLYETLGYLQCRDGRIDCYMEMPNNLALVPGREGVYGVLKAPGSWRNVLISDLNVREFSQVVWLEFGSNEMFRSTLEDWQKWVRSIKAFPIYPNLAVMFQMNREENADNQR